MDTRTKIVQSLDGSQWPTVIGFFDPLHAGHIRRLRELCGDAGKITVMIADPPAPILPARARAELVAALDCVAAVAIVGEAADGWADGRASVIDERSADADRARTFAQHVLARHNTRS